MPAESSPSEGVARTARSAHCVATSVAPDIRCARHSDMPAIIDEDSGRGETTTASDERFASPSTVRDGGTMTRRVRHALAVLLTVVVSLVVTLAGLIWGGPLASGAIFLTRGTSRAQVAHDLPPTYRPKHRGHVDVGTGLYIRE